MSFQMMAARGALKLGFFISSLTVATLGARLAAADISLDAQSRADGVSTARLSGGDLSDATLQRIFDAEGETIFARHDPALKPAKDADLLQGYEAGPPVVRWDLSPDEARAVNQGVPVSDAPNPAAKPFIFRGDASDRQAAVTCLTQAVYYEAGFEPLEGAQAVAQVVLNRVRHPIFPKTVCGVVYQGSDLKTGCQFSFTCDGSLKKVPAEGAWDRARSVAEHALNGFVQKGVGEATHYHTQFVLPWWEPTVTKVATVGVQIFYRWPGDLGMPRAFTGRYAGGEHVGGVLADPVLATKTEPAVSGTEADGRVHTVLAVATTPSVVEAPPTPKIEAEPLVVAALKPEAPDLKATTARSLAPSPFASRAFFSCTAGPCQHW
jgi:hypothetical protein